MRMVMPFELSLDVPVLLLKQMLNRYKTQLITAIKKLLDDV